MSEHKVFLGAVLLLATLLGGCRLEFWFSSDDDDFWTDATGVWQGTVTETGVGSFAVTGLLITGQLHVFSLTDGPVIGGTYAMSHDGLNASTTHYANAIAAASGTLSATVSTRSWINGSFTTSDSGSGTLSLRYDTLTTRGASLPAIGGNWFVTDGSESLGLAIDSTGAIHGSDTSGCIYSGQVNIINPAVNIYGIRLTASACGTADGHYAGHATLQDTNLTNGRLAFMVSNPGRAIVRTLDRT